MFSVIIFRDVCVNRMFILVSVPCSLKQTLNRSLAGTVLSYVLQDRM